MWETINLLKKMKFILILIRSLKINALMIKEGA